MRVHVCVIVDVVGCVVGCVAGNDFGAEGAAALAPVLVKLAQLRSLDLGCTCLDAVLGWRHVGVGGVYGGGV